MVKQKVKQQIEKSIPREQVDESIRGELREKTHEDGGNISSIRGGIKEEIWTAARPRRKPRRS